MVKKAERNMREFMSEWQFWVGIAYFGLAFVVVALFFINGRTSRSLSHTAKDEAVRAAAVQSNATQTRKSCIASIPELAKVDDFLSGVQVFASVLAENSRDSLASTQPGHVYQVRLHNYRRIEKALPAIQGLKLFPVPTKAQCVARADAILKAG